MGKDRHQQEVEQLRDQQHADRDLHRGLHVLLGEEAGGEDLDRDQAEEADRIGADRSGGHGQVVVGEGAVVEHQCRQGLGQQCEPDHGRRGEQQAQAQPPIEQRAVLRGVAFCMRLGQARQQHRAHGDAQDRGGKLHETIAEGDPGNASWGQVGGDLGVDDQAELGDRDPQDGRSHVPEDAAHHRVTQCLVRRQPDPREHAYFQQRGHLPQELRHATDDDTGRQRIDRRIEVGREINRREDEREVEQHRGEGGNGELAPQVQDACRQGYQRNQQDVREHPAREGDGNLEGRGVVAQAAGDQVDQVGSADDPGKRDQQQGPEEDSPDRVDNSLGAGRVGGASLSQDRNEGLGERTFGKQAAQQVGQAEGHEEGVRHRTGAERGRNQRLADQPGDAGHESKAADRGGRFEKVQRGLVPVLRQPEKRRPRRPGCGALFDPIGVVCAPGSAIRTWSRVRQPWFLPLVLDGQPLLLIRGRRSSYNTGLPCAESSTGSHFSTEITAWDFGTLIRRTPAVARFPGAGSSKRTTRMANIASARKRARQAVQLNAHNSSLRSKLRTAIKSVRKAIATGDKAAASNQFKASMSIIDTIADKRIIHKNAAARHKSRLAAAVKGMQTPAS